MQAENENRLVTELKKLPTEDLVGLVMDGAVVIRKIQKFGYGTNFETKLNVYNTATMADQFIEKLSGMVPE